MGRFWGFVERLIRWLKIQSTPKRKIGLRALTFCCTFSVDCWIWSTENQSCCFTLVMQKMSSGDLNVKCIIYIAHVHNMKKHATERWSIISMTVNLPNSSSPPVLLHTSVFWAQWHSSCLFPGYTVHKSELPAVFASWDSCDSYFSAAS